jgi:hypothetical protein
MKLKNLTKTPVYPQECLVIISNTTGLSFALEWIGLLAAIIITIFYLLVLYLSALSNTPENPFASITTRKNLIRGVQNLDRHGVLLYATGITPLIQSYPWRTTCTPRLHSYPWRTNVHATGKSVAVAYSVYATGTNTPVQLILIGATTFFIFIFNILRLLITSVLISPPPSSHVPRRWRRPLFGHGLLPLTSAGRPPAALLPTRSSRRPQPAGLLLALLPPPISLLPALLRPPVGLPADVLSSLSRRSPRSLRRPQLAGLLLALLLPPVSLLPTLLPPPVGLPADVPSSLRPPCGTGTRRRHILGASLVRPP